MIWYRVLNSYVSVKWNDSKFDEHLKLTTKDNLTINIVSQCQIECSH